MHASTRQQKLFLLCLFHAIYSFVYSSSGLATGGFAQPTRLTHTMRCDCMECCFHWSYMYLHLLVLFETASSCASSGLLVPTNGKVQKLLFRGMCSRSCCSSYCCCCYCCEAVLLQHYAGEEASLRLGAFCGFQLNGTRTRG